MGYVKINLMKNKIQKIKDDRSEEPTYKSGEVASILEQVNDGIQVIAEQYTGIIGRLDGIDGRLDGIDGRLDRLESKTDRLQEDVTEIKYKLSEKVDREEFKKMEKRVIKLETLVFAKLS